MGAQLFCALLRSVGLDVRLVCSLQLLSFASVPTTVSPQKHKPTIRMTGSDTETGNSGNESTGSTTSSIIGTGVVPKIPPPIRRFGGGAATAAESDQGYAPVSGKTLKYLEDDDHVIYYNHSKAKDVQRVKISCLLGRSLRRGIPKVASSGPTRHQDCQQGTKTGTTSK